MRAATVPAQMIEEDHLCICDHPAGWHRRHVAERFGGGIRLGRCLVHVTNGRGFPAPCGCRTYKAKKVKP